MDLKYTKLKKKSSRINMMRQNNMLVSSLCFRHLPKETLHSWKDETKTTNIKLIQPSAELYLIE